MLKGINECGIPGGLSREEEFRLLAETGFDGVELNIDRYFTDEEIAEINELQKKYNVKVIGAVTGLLWANPLTSNDPEKREKGKEAVKMLIDTAKALGAEAVLVVPGAVTPDTSYQDAYNNALQSLAELKPYIMEKQIYVCIENVWNKFLLSPLEMRDFVDKVDCEYVQSYFDGGNVLVNSFPDYWVEILGKRIKRVHIKDFKCSIGNITGFCDLLDGDLDFARFMKSLREVGYDSYITIEIGCDAEAKEFLARESAHLDKIFAM